MTESPFFLRQEHKLPAGKVSQDLNISIVKYVFVELDVKLNYELIENNFRELNGGLYDNKHVR